MKNLNKKIVKNISVEMFCQNVSTKSKGFTLVELIIVITILAILATIAFISFQGYTKNARDSNRTSTLANLQKGLDIYSVQVGTSPEPEGIILSGTLNGVQLNRLGVIGDNISKLVKLNKTPTDPVSGNNYAYGISSDNKSYQIGVTLENLESYNGITQNTYADNGSFKAKVVGNYKYPLKVGNKLYSLPSLLFTGTGGDLSQTGSAYFIVDKGLNVPYTPDKTTLNNTQSTTQVLQSITGTGNLVLTGIIIPSLTSTEFKALTSTSSTLQNLQQGLGITDQTQLGNTIYGSNYSSSTSVNATSGGSTPSNSCNSIQPTNATLTTGSPTSVNQAWQNTNSANPCYFTCNSSYIWDGNACSIRSASFTGGVANVNGFIFQGNRVYEFSFSNAKMRIAIPSGQSIIVGTPSLDVSNTTILNTKVSIDSGTTWMDGATAQNNRDNAWSYTSIPGNVTNNGWHARGDTGFLDIETHSGYGLPRVQWSIGNTSNGCTMNTGAGWPSAISISNCNAVTIRRKNGTDTSF